MVEVWVKSSDEENVAKKQEIVGKKLSLTYRKN